MRPLDNHAVLRFHPKDMLGNAWPFSVGAADAVGRNGTRRKARGAQEVTTLRAIATLVFGVHSFDLVVFEALQMAEGPSGCAQVLPLEQDVE